MKTANCSNCGVKLSNDNVALSLKILGKGTSQLLCCSCLAERIGCTTQLLLNKTNQLKAAGCEFFVRKYVSEE